MEPGDQGILSLDERQQRFRIKKAAGKGAAGREGGRKSRCANEMEG